MQSFFIFWKLCDTMAKSVQKFALLAKNEVEESKVKMQEKGAAVTIQNPRCMNKTNHQKAVKFYKIYQKAI